MFNTIKTVILLGALTGLLLFLGGLLGGRTGLTFALVLAAVMNIGAYWFSDRIVLAMTGAKPVDPRSAPELWNMVRRVADRMNMPMPRLYVVPLPQPNAFATGRDPQHAVVAVSPSIMEILDARELEGVIAHELGHVGNRDTLVSAVAATIAGAITYVAHMALWFGPRGDDDEGANPLVGLLLALLAPIAALIIQAAISRSRELSADATGAQSTQDPLGLASALQKIDAVARQVPARVDPATAHLFFVNPLSGRTVVSLFSTHPPTAERVRRLRAMAGLAD
jgi:heat shock protein HtpX